MAKRTKDIGNIRLSELKHEVAVKAGVEGIFIPFNENPCIFVNKKEGRTTVDLDIEVMDTPRSQFSDKMVKASLPKSVRQKHNLSFDSDEYKRLTPILGNLKTYEFDDAGRGTQPSSALADNDDLPPGLAGDGEWGPAPSANDWR